MDIDAVNIRLHRLEREARPIIDEHSEAAKRLDLVRTAVVAVGGRLDKVETAHDDHASEIAELRKTVEAQAAKIEEFGGLIKKFQKSSKDSA